MFYIKSDSFFSSEILQGIKSSSNEELGIDWEMLRAVAKSFLGDTCFIEFTNTNSTFNRVFCIYNNINRYILRFTLPVFEGYEANLHLQQWISSEAILEKVLTPRIIVTDTTHKICPFDYQIIEEIPGKTLFEERYNEELVCNVLKEVAENLNKLHQIRAKNYGLMGFNLYKSWEKFLDTNIDIHVDYLMKHDLIEDGLSLVMIYNDAMNNLPFVQSKLLHGDLSYHNIIVKDGKFAGIIDWEDALFGDPIFDYANLATFHPERRHKVFTDIFPKKPVDFDRRFWLYFLRISISKAVHRHKFGIVDKPENGFLPANDRIKLAISKLKTL